MAYYKNIHNNFGVILQFKNRGLDTVCFIFFSNFLVE